MKVINKKIISLFTAAVFLFSIAANDLYAVAVSIPSVIADGNVSADFQDMIRTKTLIPSSYGKVTAVSDMQSDTVIINIQDLHAHSNTQRNIARIIEAIGSNFKLSGIYVEGGVGDIDISWINAVQDEKIKEEIIEQLLEGGDLTASEYYAMIAKEPYPIKGIENKEIHQANLKRLAALDANKEKYEDVLKKIDKEIKILNKIYTNSRNVRFSKMFDKYNNGKITDAKFYKLLQKYVEKISANPEKYNVTTKIDLNDYPNIQFYLSMLPAAERTDYKKVTNEMQFFVSSLKSDMPYNQYKQLTEQTNNFSDTEKFMRFIVEFFKEYPESAEKYGELGKLVKINELAEALNPVELITEQRQLTEKIKFALSYDNTEAEISFITDFKKYFKDYLTAQLMQGDWLYVKDNLEQFKEIFGKYAAYNALKEIEADLPAITHYYDVNTDRNSVFLSNLFDRGEIKTSPGRNDKKGDAFSMLSNAGDIKIVVTGGYHSEGLRELFDGKNISSMVITPNVTADVQIAQDRYMEIIKEQAKFPANALAAALLSGTPNTNQIAKIFQAAVNAGVAPADIEKLIRDFDLSGRAVVSNENITIDGEEAVSLTKKSVKQSAISKGFDLLRTLNITDNFSFDNLETVTLKTVGSVFAYFGAGEAGIISGVEKAGLENAEFIAGVHMSEFTYYPAFIQEILLNKQLIKERSVFMVSRQELNERMDKYDPTVYIYRKVPTFGIQIPKFSSPKAAGEWLTEIDKKFNNKLIAAIGSVDQMEWWGYVSNDEGNKAIYAQIKEALENAVTDEEKKQILLDNSEFMNAGLIEQVFKNPGGIIALQDKVNIDGEEELDCYIIDLAGIGRYEKDGKLITLTDNEVNERNVDENGKTLEERLSSLLGISGLSSISGIVGVHKQADEAMIRAEDIGLNVPAAATKQKQEMKNGAFFVLDKNGKPKYVVNADGKGKPVLYEYAGEAKTDIVEFANAGEAATGAEIDAFFANDMTINAMTTKLLRGMIKKLKPKAFEFRKEAPIYGYKIPSDLNTVDDIEAFMESLPEGLLKKLGSVDNTKYRSFVDPYGGLSEEEYVIIEKMFGINKEQLDSVKAEMLAAKTDEETGKIIEANADFFKAAFQYQFFKDKGSVIALQMNGDSLDSYIIGVGAYGNYDKDVDVEQYYSGGISLKDQLEREIDSALDMSNVIGLKKKLKVTATMIPAHTLGLNISVASSASEKGQKTSSGAFIYIGLDDKGEWEWYVVNAEAGSYKPIFYELVEVKAAEASGTDKAAEEETEENKVSRALFGYDSETANRIIDEIRENHTMGSQIIDPMIINTVAGIEGYIFSSIAPDGNINMSYKLSASPANPEMFGIIYTGLMAYLESNGTEYKKILTVGDIAVIPEYFRNLINVLVKEGAYRLWKKGELTPAAEDLQYFERLESDAKAIYEAKKAKVEEIGKYLSGLNRDNLDKAQRQIYNDASAYYNNARRQLDEYYKDPLNPAFGELLAVSLSENDSVPDLARIKNLDIYIDGLENIAASSGTELTLRWWPLNWPAEMNPWTNIGRAKRRAENKASQLRLSGDDARQFVKEAVQRARERRATYISISELPLTLLLPARTFVLLHFNRDERRILKRYLAGDYSVLNDERNQDLADKFAVRLEGERAIKRIEGASEKEIMETRLGGARGIKRQTIKWFVIGVPIVFAMFFLLDYTDRHIITTRPFGDLRWVSSGEAAKVVFSDLINNIKQMTAVVAGAGIIGAIGNAVAHRFHNLIPKVIKARATLDLSGTQYPDVKTMSTEALQNELSSHYAFEEYYRSFPESMRLRVIELKKEISSRKVEEAKTADTAAVSTNMYHGHADAIAVPEIDHEYVSPEKNGQDKRYSLEEGETRYFETGYKNKAIVFSVKKENGEIVLAEGVSRQVQMPWGTRIFFSDGSGYEITLTDRGDRFSLSGFFGYPVVEVVDGQRIYPQEEAVVEEKQADLRSEKLKTKTGAVPHYDEITDTTAALQDELEKLEDSLMFTLRYYSAVENPPQAREYEEGIEYVNKMMESAFFRDVKAVIPSQYYGKLAFMWDLQKEGHISWGICKWLLTENNAANFFERLDKIEKNINTGDLFNKIPNILLYVSRINNIDTEKISNKDLELLIELEQYADVLMIFSEYADGDIFEKLKAVKLQDGEITRSVFVLTVLGFGYEKIKEMDYRAVTEELSIVFDSNISRENPINAVLGDMFVTGRFLPIDTERKLNEVFEGNKNTAQRERDKKNLTDNSLGVTDFYSFFSSRMRGDLVDGRSLDGSVVFGIEKFRGSQANMVHSPANFWPSHFGMQNWHELVDEFGYGDVRWTYQNYMELFPEVMKKIATRGQPIVFMLPSNFDYTKEGFTAGEFRYLLENPEHLKNVIFVVGAYDFFEIDSSVEDVDSYLSMNFLAELLKDYQKYISPSVKSKGTAKDFDGMLKEFKEKLDEYISQKTTAEEEVPVTEKIEDAKEKLEAAVSAAERSKAMMLLLQIIQSSPAHADMYMRVFPLFAQYSLGFASSVSGRDAGTAFVVYTTDRNLQGDIEKYGSIPGVVFIVNDIIGDKAVGINKNGVPLREVENENKNIKVFSANGVPHDEINKYLQNSRVLKNISSFVVVDTVNKKDISFDGDIIKAGIDLIENRIDGTYEDYIAELSDIQRKWRNAQADKNIFDIAHLDAETNAATINSIINALATQRTEQYIKIMLNESQLGMLMKALNERTIKDLSMLGVEIFLSVESINEEKKMDMRVSMPGISGVLVNDENLIDLNSGEELKARLFLKEGDLKDNAGKQTTLDDLLSDGKYEGYNIIGLNLMKDSVSGRNVLKNGGVLNAALGWLGKTFNLKEVTVQDAVNMAQQTEFSKVLRIDGELTESAAREKIQQLSAAQTMLGQLTGEVKTAYEETLIATVIKLNMIERKRGELTAQGRGEKMVIEKDRGMQKTLTELIIKAVRMEGFNFNGADYLHAIPAEVEMDLTVGAIIARALEDDASKEDVELAIAVIVDSEFIPMVSFGTNVRDEAEKKQVRLSGVRAILYQA